MFSQTQTNNIVAGLDELRIKLCSSVSSQENNDKQQQYLHQNYYCFYVFYTGT